MQRLVCPVNQFKPAQTRCDEGDDNTCTIGQCDGSSSGCRTIVLPDLTECQAACGNDATCLDGQCVCPCDVPCAFTKGWYAGRAPCEQKGNQETDPAWLVPSIQQLQICGLSACELLTSKGKLSEIAGSAQAVAENWLAVHLELQLQIQQQGFGCSGPRPDVVFDAYQAAQDAIFNDPTFCSRKDYPPYNQLAETLSRWSEGKFEDQDGPASCKKRTASVAVIGGGGGSSSDDDDSLSRGDLIAVIVVSVVTGLAAVAILGFYFFCVSSPAGLPPKRL